MTGETVLQLQGITKRFGPLLANEAISLDLKRGEVLALLGENGAGKSTLVSILFGHYTADAGHITAFGRSLPPGNPKAALAAGIGMVHQHFTLADNLSVLDNVVMGTEPLWQPFSRRTQARARLADVGQRFGLAVQADAKVGDLSVGERQRVEILKALYRGARILILDEPTAVLTPQESEALFDTLGRMVAEGLSVIFISHKLGEVLRVSHRVAVLRAGKLVAQAPAAGTTQGQLAQWMVGHSVSPSERQPASQVGDVVLCMDKVSTGSPAGRPARSPEGQGHRDRLHEVSLSLRRGEIVAIAGVSGNGQVALAELLCGTRHPNPGQGTLTLHGQALQASPAWLVTQGVARIPEDRHAVGVVGDLPLWENAVSERLRGPAFSRSVLGVPFWVRRKAARAHAQRVLEAFDVRGAGPQSLARSLSGGNMQKLILGRALLAPSQPLPPPSAAPMASRTVQVGTAAVPTLIVAHQPTWGLDIGAVAYVQQQLIAARDAGAAVLVISDDLDEVMALGDRIAVMHGGQLTAARPATDWTRESIGLAMAGVDTGEPAGKGLAHAA